MRLVTVIAEVSEADALFDQIYTQADMHRPGGGELFMTPLTFATPFALPEGVANESGENSHA